MPSRPDQPCSICGKLLWSGKGCRPADQRICRDCRAAARQYEPSEYVIACVECDAEFTAHSTAAKTCSFECRKQRLAKQNAANYHGTPSPTRDTTVRAIARTKLRAKYFAPRTCEWCGATYTPSHRKQRTCGHECGFHIRYPGCRRESRACEMCGSTFNVPRSSKQRTCKRACGLGLQRITRGWAPKVEKWPSSKVYFIDCVQCGKLATVRTKLRKACSPECSKLLRNATQLAYMNNRYAQVRPRVIDRAHRIRTEHIEIPAERIDIHYLCRRDKWTCQLCGAPVKPFEDCGKRDPLSPSVDHIVPVTLGGPHIYTNVQLAHLKCNRAKGNRVNKRLAEAMLNAFAEQYAHQC